MTIPPTNPAPRIRYNHWLKSPRLVKIMFREAYTELVEKPLRPCKYALPYHHVDLHEIFMLSAERYGVFVTCRLQKEGFDEACEFVGLKPTKKGDCL